MTTQTIRLAPTLSWTAAALLLGSPALRSQESRPQAEAPPPKTSGSPQAATAEEKDEEALAVYRQALATISSARKAAELAPAMKVLSEGFAEARPLLPEAFRSGSPAARVFILRLLGEEGGGAEDIALASEALRHPHPQVRVAAVMALRHLGNESFQALADLLPREAEPNVRKMVIQTFAFWKDERSIPHLARQLKREGHAQVRSFCVSALQKLTGKSLGDDPGAWARVAQEWLDSQASREMQEFLKKSSSKSES